MKSMATMSMPHTKSMTFGALSSGGGMGMNQSVDVQSKRQQLEEARNQENLRKIQQALIAGIPFLKHNRKGKVVKRVLRSVDVEATAIRWDPADGTSTDRSVFASSDRPRRVRDIVLIQKGCEPDPKKPEFGGTRTLRKSAGKKAIFKSFSLHFHDRTLDMEFTSNAEFKEVYEGLKLLIKHVKAEVAKVEYGAYYANQNAQNKLTWVPTTDDQGRTYFYNLYTKDTRWSPPAGAPRIELSWWEKSYLERMENDGDADEEFA